MHSLIQQILDKKRTDLALEKSQVPLERHIKAAANILDKRAFATVFEKLEKSTMPFIAEIKLTSPSEGKLGDVKQITNRVHEYEQAGAAALSVVTERHFFNGSLSHATFAKHEVKIPVLVKDFIIDEYQIYQAAAAEADAILLIARIVEADQLISFVKKAFACRVEPVVEIHNEKDLEKAVTSGASIVAVNARDLETLEVDVDRACELIHKLPTSFVRLAFSGVQSKEAVYKYRKAGAQGVLIGTSLMKTQDVAALISSFELS